MAYQETIGAAADATHSLPRVRTITPRDLIDALAKGLDDFRAMPTHVIFLSVIYPVAGRSSPGELRLRPGASALSAGDRFCAGRAVRSDRRL